MKNCLIIIFFMLLRSATQAQDVADTTCNTSITYLLEAAGRNNSLPASFYYRFHRGGFLDRPYLEQKAERLKQDNTGGFDYKNGFYAERSIDSISKFSGFSVGLRMEDRFHLSAAFNRDLFRLAFFGNKIFEGSTAVSGPFSFRSLSYRYYGLHFGKFIHGEDERYRISGELAYLEGRRGVEIDVSTATLTTALGGKFVQLDLNGSFYETDTTRFGGDRFFWPASGNGMAGSLNIEWWQKEGHYMRFSAKDIGFIDWKTTGMNYTADTALKFEGFVIPNVITYHDSIFRMSTDSLRRLNPEGFRGSRRIFLPAWFSMDYVRRIPELPLSVCTGIVARAFTSYRPLLYAGCTWHIHEGSNLNLTIGSGGWGGINANATFDLVFFKSWRLQTGLMQLESVFTPRNVRGLGMLLGITKQFNTFKALKKK